MATYVKYDTSLESLCNKLIDCFGPTDTWNAIIHTDPPVTTDSVIGDLVEIYASTQNGYTFNGNSIGFNSTRTTGTITATAVDVTWTVTTSNWPGTARYVTVVDFTSAAKNTWCYWDYGTTFAALVGETFTLDFGATFWTMT
jgi:hypothetical protein